MNNIDYDKIEYIQKKLEELLGMAGFANATVQYEQSLTKGLVFNISVNRPSQLIGRQGQVLLALEHLMFALVNRHFKEVTEPIRFTLDIDDYRRKREWSLKQLVKEAVSELKQGKDFIVLPTMPRHERKFVHSYIQEQFPHLHTESLGQEPRRQIKIMI